MNLKSRASCQSVCSSGLTFGRNTKAIASGAAAAITGITAAAAYLDAKYHIRKDLRGWYESYEVRKVGERAGMYLTGRTSKSID